MSQLELIWGLEKYNTHLEEHKKDLNIIKNNVELTQLKNKYSLNEIEINGLIKTIDAKKNELQNNENRVKNNTFNLKELDEALYDGKVTDFKQLDYLNKEKDKIKDLLETIEAEVISLIDETNELMINLNNLKKNTNLTIRAINKYNKNNSTLYNEMNDKIKIVEDKIEEHTKEINENVLKRYKTLRKNRGRGIVSVINNVCTGCNMMVPSYLHEKIRSKNEILYCESCGRILYHKADNE